MSQPILRGLLVCLALLPAGCVGPEEFRAEHPKRELTAEEFRDLLAKGTIQPVEGMGGGEPFDNLDPGMGDEAPIPGTRRDV